MDFRITDDQQALQEGVRSFCAGRVPLDRLRELEGPGFDAGLWKELAEMGVFSLRLPEEQGGVGLGTTEAVLVFEELGRALVPGPLWASHLAAGRIPGAAEGEVVATGLDLLQAAREPLVLEHLATSPALLVLRPEGVFRVDPAEIEARPLDPPLDPLTPVHLAAGLPAGEPLGDADLARQLWLEGAALTAAQLLGIAEAAQELATSYAKKREQFGRPIGSFQALKHILADCYVRQEIARAAVYAAGATLDGRGVSPPERAVAVARVMATEAALRNTRACVQVHGGMGYTWEMPPHYYLKRAYVLTACFGSVGEHTERLLPEV